MPRRRRGNEEEDVEQSAAAEVPAAAYASAPGTAVSAAAASGAALNVRAAAQAAVARNRADFFARGAGSGAAQQAALAAADSDDSSVDESGAAAVTSWPGPWSTARQLLRDREAARAAHQEEVETGGAAGAAAAGASSSSLVEQEALPVKRKGDTAETAALRGVYVADWKPATARLSAGGVLPRRFGGDAEYDPSLASLSAGGEATRSSSSSKASKAAAAVAQKQSDSRRRAMAIAGPSGVRLTVPPLTVLCMESLLRYLGNCEELGPLNPAVRRKFATSVCRNRAMDNHAFFLFASGCGEELSVPDCAGVDESHMISALLAVGGSSTLQTLTLGNCGRGLTPRALKHVAPRVFSGLRTLSIAGAHVVGSEALLAALRCAPLLQHLSVSFSPILGGEFLAELPRVTPLLESLYIDGCPLIGDGALLGSLPVAAAAVTAVQKTSSSAAQATSGDDASGDDDDDNDAPVAASSPSFSSAAAAAVSTHGHSSSSSSSSAAVAASDASSSPEREAALAAASALLARGFGSVLALPLLSSLSLRQLPLLTDVFFKAFLAAREERSASGGGKGGAAGPADEATGPSSNSGSSSSGGGEKRSKNVSGSSSRPQQQQSASSEPQSSVTSGSKRRLEPAQLAGGSSASFDSSAAASSSCSSAGPPRSPLLQLCIDRCPGVTSKTVKALAKSRVTPGLTTLELEGQQACGGRWITKLAENAVGLRRLSLKRTVGVPSDALMLFAVNSGHNLVDVCFAGMTELDDAALVALGRLSPLTLRTLDVSMCRGITDEGLGCVVDGCPQLSRLLVWGDSQLTDVLYNGHARSAAAAPRSGPATEGWAELRIFGRSGDVMPAADV